MRIHHNHIAPLPSSSTETLTSSTPNRVADPLQKVGGQDAQKQLASASSDQSAIQLHQVAQENIAASQSSPADVEAALNLAAQTNHIILAQSATAIAAQASHSPQEAFKLLQ